jgi:hypothetical protein
MTTDLHHSRPIATLAVVIVALLAVLGPAPAAADLVVLEDGRHYKVDTYERVGDQMRLGLDGGFVTIAMSRVAPVVDDEWVPPEPVPETPVALLAVRSWLFDDGAPVPPPVPEVPFGELIYESAQRHGVHPDLVAAVVRAESAFQPSAVSHAGAQGLMQLMPATAERFGLRGGQVFEPARNIDAGTRYLAWLLNRFDGDLALTLAGYNAGEGTVDRYQGVPPYRETRGYIQKIFRTLGLAPNELTAAL